MVGKAQKSVSIRKNHHFDNESEHPVQVPDNDHDPNYFLKICDEILSLLRSYFPKK